MSTTPPPEPISVAALYRFAPLADPEALRAELASLCERLELKGTLLVAAEGINGTIAGSAQGVAALVDRLAALPEVGAPALRMSTAREMPFHRMKVKVKREIVTLGVDGIDAANEAGTYVEPDAWNALIDDPDTIVIDTRNRYETALGSFSGAVDPGTDSFTAFPEWLAQNREMLEGRRVAMFCTGGIRCEKATALLRAEGIADVHHLRGGILNYLESVPADESRWNGECFVFDERVSVTHGLRQGEASLCRACRHPLTAADRALDSFVEGVSCRHCVSRRSEEDRARYGERHRQIGLAARRGLRHIGR